MGLFSGLFGKSKNPANSAMPYLNQITPMAEQRLNPYIQRGNESGQRLQGEYQNLTDNPVGFYNDIMGQYTESEGFKNAYDRALRAMQNTSAATGTLGTSADNERIGGLASQLAMAGQRDWLSDILGLYGKGIEGEQGFSDQGYKANEDLTGIMGNALSSKAGLAFQGQQQKNQLQNELLRAIISGGAMYAGGKAGGGSIW